jgi:transcription elongation factor Elf1
MKAQFRGVLEYILEGAPNMANETQVNKVQMVTLNNVNIKNCYACGQEHLNIEVTALEKPVEWYNFKAMCPFTQKEIFIKFVTE